MTGDYDINILITTSNKKELSILPTPASKGRNETCISTVESQQQNGNRFVFNLHVIIRFIVRAVPFIFSISHPANET